MKLDQNGAFNDAPFCCFFPVDRVFMSSLSLFFNPIRRCAAVAFINQPAAGFAGRPLPSAARKRPAGKRRNSLGGWPLARFSSTLRAATARAERF